MSINLPKTTTRELKFTLTDEEKVKFSESIAKKLGAVEQAKLNKKASAKQYDNQIQNLESEINEVKTNINNGYIYKRVELQIDYNLDEQRKYILQDGKIIDSERMTQEELDSALQLELELEQADVDSSAQDAIDYAEDVSQAEMSFDELPETEVAPGPSTEESNPLEGKPFSVDKGDTFKKGEEVLSILKVVAPDEDPFKATVLTDHDDFLGNVEVSDLLEAGWVKV